MKGLVYVHNVNNKPDCGKADMSDLVLFPFVQIPSNQNQIEVVGKRETEKEI